MQTFKIYSVYDSALEEFLTPFTCKNDKLAVRMFESAKNNDKIVVDDLSLFSMCGFSCDLNGLACASDYHKVAEFVNGNCVVISEVE